MVLKKSEISTTSTIEFLLPPIPSVPKILEENLKYEEEMKRMESMNRSTYRKRNRSSLTSTKFLPDWINDLQCEWAHNHDFRKYSKQKTTIPLNAAIQKLCKPNPIIPNKKKQRKQSIPKHDKSQKDPTTKQIIKPSKTSPVFESPAQSPDEKASDNDIVPTDLKLATKTSPKLSTNSQLTPLDEVSFTSFEYPISRRNALTQNNNNNMMKVNGARSRSASANSVGSEHDYGMMDPVQLSLQQQQSLSHSDKEIDYDLQRELTMHLEKYNEDNVNNLTLNEDNMMQRTVRSDSLMPSELKRRYKSKIKEIGFRALKIKKRQSSNLEVLDKKNSKKHGRRWRRKGKKNDSQRRIASQSVIDEETENQEFDSTNISISRSVDNVLTTPSREYSSSYSKEENEESVQENNNETESKSEETKSLKSKVKKSNSMFSRLFSKIHSWTDKNRQAFNAYLTLLKQSILREEQNIKSYQSELHSIKRQMVSELKRWKKWAQIEAENMARTYYENKYLLLSSQIEISSLKLTSLEEIASKVQFVLDGNDMEKVKNIIFDFDHNANANAAAMSKQAKKFANLPNIVIADDDEQSNLVKVEYRFKNPHILWSADGKLNGLEHALPTLIDVEKALRTQYESLIKGVMIQQSASERANIYRRIILDGYKCKSLIRSQNYHYHPCDSKGVQIEFNCLLIDDRYSEGKILRKWRKEIQKKYNKAYKIEQTNNPQNVISAQDINDFLQELTTQILKYPIYQRSDWNPQSLDDKDVTNLNDIKQMHEYGMKYVDTYYALKLYLDRLVFPRLAFNKKVAEDESESSLQQTTQIEKVPIWHCLYSDEEKQFDAEYVINCEWMRNLTQSQISIPSEYQKNYGISAQFNSRLAIKNNMIHPELPYFDAILSFNRAQKVYVPNDILYCFIEGLRLINSAASHYKYKNDLMRIQKEKEQKKKNLKLDTIDEEVKEPKEKEENEEIEKENVQLSADDLFPILVWIMVHCRISDIHLRLGYLDKFLDESVKYFGEVGMCLSLVQAAAEFVRKKEGWHFGLDEELDKETLNTTKDEDVIKENDGGDDDEIVI